MLVIDVGSESEKECSEKEASVAPRKETPAENEDDALLTSALQSERAVALQEQGQENEVDAQENEKGC